MKKIKNIWACIFASSASRIKRQISLKCNSFTDCSSKTYYVICEMYKFYFFITENILNGCVGCAYCLQTNIWKFQSLAQHFKFRCEKICLLNDCLCEICVHQTPLLQKNDFDNVYLNRRCAPTYFFPSISHFWGQTNPFFLIENPKTGHVAVMTEAPVPAA